MKSAIEQYSIRDLLSAGVDYVVPMYQRNYAWGEGEITQLIQDVIDSRSSAGNYYIGTLVVFELQGKERATYEVIDGQQRLTTLSLLASYLKKNCPERFTWYQRQSIDFESRVNSRKTFNGIFGCKPGSDPADLLAPNEINSSILEGYRLIRTILPVKLNEYNVSEADFSEFLTERVQVMRVLVPGETDLNHYFEIMNNRGEQLEKHEVLKSRLMKILKEDGDAQYCLHAVWEACANMEKYVQMGFNTSQRDAVFGDNDWGRFSARDFDDLKALLISSKGISKAEGNKLPLSQIIETPLPANKQTEAREEPSERFNTIINFPNFLLHVLRVSLSKDVPLDDKRLLSEFQRHIIESTAPLPAVKKFIFDLLKCKYLFDTYILKREFIGGTDGWSLKRLKCRKTEEIGDNRRVMMLLSAFHVSTPTPVYKYWLYAALKYLFSSGQIHGDKYLAHLESVAKAFVFDRFVANEKREYAEMIDIYGGTCQVRAADITLSDIAARTSFGNIENNLVFNYLDYLLWLKCQSGDPTVKEYQFTFRSSVEHYYPQNPMPGQQAISRNIVDSFGNLCLISHSKNSRLSNLPPSAKKAYYKGNQIDSIKQYIMMASHSDEGEGWNAECIERHQREMIGVLIESLELRDSASSAPMKLTPMSAPNIGAGKARRAAP
jgi:hypothetical protein